MCAAHSHRWPAPGLTQECRKSGRHSRQLRCFLLYPLDPGNRQHKENHRCNNHLNPGAGVNRAAPPICRKSFRPALVFAKWINRQVSVPAAIGRWPKSLPGRAYPTKSAGISYSSSETDAGNSSTASRRSVAAALSAATAWASDPQRRR